MDLETLEAQLRHAEWSVALSEMEVYDLTGQIAELERGGHGIRHTIARCAELRVLLDQHIANRDRLKNELESRRVAYLNGEGEGGG